MTTPALEKDRSRRPHSITDPVQITHSEQLRAAYRDGPFYYQYRHPGGVLTRVMICDNEAERDLIIDNVRNGSEMLIGRS